MQPARAPPRVSGDRVHVAVQRDEGEVEPRFRWRQLRRRARHPGSPPAGDRSPAKAAPARLPWRGPVEPDLHEQPAPSREPRRRGQPLGCGGGLREVPVALEYSTRRASSCAGGGAGHRPPLDASRVAVEPQRRIGAGLAGRDRRVGVEPARPGGRATEARRKRSGGEGLPRLELIAGAQLGIRLARPAGRRVRECRSRRWNVASARRSASCGDQLGTPGRRRAARIARCDWNWPSSQSGVGSPGQLSLGLAELRRGCAVAGTLVRREQEGEVQLRQAGAAGSRPVQDRVAERRRGRKLARELRGAASTRSAPRSFAAAVCRASSDAGRAASSTESSRGNRNG